MSLADSEKWDERYRGGEYAERRNATALIAKFATALKPGRALDVGCGAGRNALFLAASGFEVDAIDISSAGLERLRVDAEASGAAIRRFAADLEDGLPDDLPLHDLYDLVVMVRYVNRSLIAALPSLLAVGGVLIIEQHLRTAESVVGPSNPDYRLMPNELLDTVRGLRLHYYREGAVTDPDGRRAALAQLVASNGEIALFND